MYQQGKTLKAFGVTIQIIKAGEKVHAIITKEGAVQLSVTAPPEPERFPFSQCGAMC